MGLKRRQEEDGEALENECGIKCALLLTPGFSSDEHQTESETKEETGKNLGGLQNRIFVQHKNIKSDNRHHF